MSGGGNVWTVGVRVDPWTARRVLVDHEGLSPQRARERYPELRLWVMFIRRDGWSLAAPMEAQLEAYDLWADEWTEFALAEGGWIVKPISEFFG